MSNQKVVMIGLGYIGLPTAALIANNGIHVHGVDINPQVVETINMGKIHIVEPSLDQAVATAVSKGLLQAATTPIESNTYLIVVPTPFKANNEPDISFVEAATKSIITLLKENDLYIIESTSPIGTTEKMMRYIYSERPELQDKLHIAYCPERVLPGNVMHELVNNDRVIGGVNEAATQKAIEFYKQFVKGELHPTNARTAEMCKLVENSSRDVQIAFANELSMICDKANVDVWELIHLANKHPRVKILQPGSGVGGHCIAVDPWFLISDFPSETMLIKQARIRNLMKTNWVIEKIKDRVQVNENQLKRKIKIAYLGLAFKPDIDDLRESPAVEIVEKLKTLNVDTYIVEPNIQSFRNFKLCSIEEAICLVDILVILVAHKEFTVENIHPFQGEIISFVNYKKSI
jgi:UDP-N-acetyl-D-mannosaminuronic acid dehydrogenase